jgi:hypothetical protein
MNLKTYMILCVTCALNWMAIAYRTVQTICRKFPKLYAKKGNLAHSISGMLTSIVKKTESSFQLDMMTVR